MPQRQKGSAFLAFAGGKRRDVSARRGGGTTVVQRGEESRLAWQATSFLPLTITRKAKCIR